MKYVVGALIAVLPQLCSAQMVCKVYQRMEGMESRKCVLTRTFDDMGRIAHEQVNNFYVCLEDPYTLFCCKEDGLYDYYYEDTSLYKMVITEFDDRRRTPIDSGKVFYHYDSLTGRIKDELAVKHLKIRPPGKKPGGYRNTTTYVYDNKGTMTTKQNVHGDNSAQYFRYDDRGRVISDSISYFADGFCMVTRYEYTPDGYRRYAWSNERRYPEVTAIKLDAQGRVIDKTTWLHKREDIDGGHSTRSFSWRAYLGKGLGSFNQFDRTATRYDEQGRVAETQYYYQGRRTTTHTYEYENGPAGG